MIAFALVHNPWEACIGLGNLAVGAATYFAGRRMQASAAGKNTYP
jgi:hypothetical protein